MIVWNNKELVEALSGELLEHNIDEALNIDEVVIDSRKTPKNGLFIALKGDNNDGHDYLAQAFENGCCCALVDDKKNITNQKFILVKNTFIALYKLAQYSRNRSKAKIVAITGSVGKTGTKEMLKSAFLSQGKTFATQGNLNNHIGAPLSLCNFSADYEYGIFEIGMNHLGEIDPLSKLVNPDLAIITNVGPVHIEFFKDEQEIALAKSEIFSGLKNNGIALINADNQHFDFIKERAKSCKIKEENIISFAKKTHGTYQILNSEIKAYNLSLVSAKLKNNSKISYQISSSNPAVIFNSIIVIACIDLLGKNLEKSLNIFKELESVAGRGKIKEIKINQKTITIIDDSYNASAPSIKAGITHAVSLKNSLKKNNVVIALGDMLELGEKSVELHQEIINYLKNLNIDFAVLVGKNMINAAKNLPNNSYKTFLDSNLAALEIENFLQDGDILYVKGSRGMKMEKIIEKLNIS